MCPSMEDSEFYTKNSQKPSPEVPTTNHANNNPSKYFNNFLYKSIIVTIFLVIIPFLPSQAPEFITQNLHARSWELLQLIFVGIAVSYGIFSKRNDENLSSDTTKENYSKVDNAQSYVSRLLQVSSVFDDHETENPSPISEENKVQTWNSQYYREEPKSILEKQSSLTRKIDEKPLLLPVRSLKSRVLEQNQGELTETLQESSVKIESFGRSNSNSGSKRFAGNSRKSRNGEVSGTTQVKVEENVVHRSPIPWRSRSGRLEMKGDEESLFSSISQPPLMEDSEPIRLQSSSLRSQSIKSSKPTTPPTPSSPKIQSFLPNLSSESQEKKVEDVVRKKIYYKSSAPPPPPPPPPPPFLHKSLMKSKSSLSSERDYHPQKEMKRSIRSVPNDLSETENSDDVPFTGKSVRTIRQSESLMMNPAKNKEEFADKLMLLNSLNLKRKTKTEFPEEEVIEKVLVETDDEDSETESEDDEYFEEVLGNSGDEEKAKNENSATTTTSDEGGPDVDKKADEFIAKFREQIRLQRIESIRRSAGQLARNPPR